MGNGYRCGIGLVQSLGVGNEAQVLASGNQDTALPPTLSLGR
ncbi:MAG TPA: hypothetical protein V6D12_24490 [Candidatus Obscuribacterales bacterium]